MTNKEDVLKWMRTTTDCKECPLYGSTTVLWERLWETSSRQSSKNEACDVLFVGINPGQDEAIQGRPFIGKSGKLLRERINALGISFYHVAFSNAILCSTPNETKIPNITECIGHCRRFTDTISKILNPLLFVAVGKQCANVYFGINGSMKELNGKLSEPEHVIPIVHPAFVVRMPTAENKEMFDYGLEQVKKYLDEHVPF